MNKKIFVSSLGFLICSVIFSVLFKNAALGFNSLFAGLLITAFSYFNRKYSIFNMTVYVYFVIFIILSVYMGRALKFYKVIFFWDKILHFYFGIISYPAGLCIFKKLKGDAANKKLKIVFSLMFSFSLALLWEVWEFSGDKIFGLNSQNNSLSDTMWDMILASWGAILYMLFHKAKRYKNQAM